VRHLPTVRAQPAIRSALLAFALLGAGAACVNNNSRVHSALTERAEKYDALGLSDELEALIAEGKDTPEDRAYAYYQVQGHDDGTAAYAFARAAVTGRFVQARGLTKGPLIAEVERYARQSRTLDPTFRNSAATRLLGTLYVVAPGALLKHGNSEDGLAMLEELVKKHPEVIENHLRLAEAYMALGDPKPALPHLCRCVEKKSSLRKDDQKLLDHLVFETGKDLNCSAAGAAPSAVPAAPK
jgi:tetratricopeptide (TPR) repeat protein